MIETKGLRRVFRTKVGDVEAVAGVDLKVIPGEIFGFLGPNGAGKSTTMRMLVTLLPPSGGTATVAGFDLHRQPREVRQRIGYVAQGGGSDPSETGRAELVHQGRVFGLGRDDARRRAAELLERFDLDPRKKARSYSKGNRQKVALVAALASDAELLVLDEPTSGLDPLMEAVFQDCVRELRDQGRTLLLSSHILAEAEALCDRVSIIRHGRTVQSGSLPELRHLTRTSVTVETERPVAGLVALPGVHDVVQQDGRARFDVDSDHLGGAVRHLTDFGIRSLGSSPPTLEELFLRHYGDELAAEADAGAGGPVAAGPVR